MEIRSISIIDLITEYIESGDVNEALSDLKVKAFIPGTLAIFDIQGFMQIFLRFGVSL